MRSPAPDPTSESDATPPDTAWRKTPDYMGGFLLDGGVHFVAAARLLLGAQNKIHRVSSFTAQLQPHLPPVDTVHATARCASGIAGTIAISFGTTFKGRGYSVACEQGTVEVGFDKVTVERDGRVEVKEFPNHGTGVKEELEAFLKGIRKGRLDPAQSPEEALRDLELVGFILLKEIEGKCVTNRPLGGSALEERGARWAAGRSSTAMKGSCKVFVRWLGTAMVFSRNPVSLRAHPGVEELAGFSGYAFSFSSSSNVNFATSLVSGSDSVVSSFGPSYPAGGSAHSGNSHS